jgi:hypothetical protein
MGYAFLIFAAALIVIAFVTSPIKERDDKDDLEY